MSELTGKGKGMPMTMATTQIPGAGVVHRGTKGMTLLEVVISLAIVATAILWTLSTLFSAIAANRIMTANIAANAAILQQREEVMVAAHSGSLSDGASDLAAAVLTRYADLLTSTATDATLPIGPNGAQVRRVRFDDSGQNRGLIVTFPIPKPGESVDKKRQADDNRDLEYYGRGYGEMIVYLNERAVPSDNAVPAFWEDLGKPVQPATAETTTGFDINGDGRIAEFTYRHGNGLKKILSNPPDLEHAGDDVAADQDGIYIHSLPIDITIYYFKDYAHEQHYFSTTRRVMVTGVTTGVGSTGK